MIECIGWTVVVIATLAGYWWCGAFLVRFVDKWICLLDGEEGKLSDVNGKEFFWLAWIFPIILIFAAAYTGHAYFKKVKVSPIKWNSLTGLRLSAVNCADWLFSKIFKQP